MHCAIDYYSQSPRHFEPKGLCRLTALFLIHQESIGPKLQGKRDRVAFSRVQGIFGWSRSRCGDVQPIGRDIRPGDHWAGWMA